MSVNQNMRFDQSMRVLKQILDRGISGAPVLATIEMRAIPALAAVSGRLRPPDAAQYERPSSRRAAFPVRRSHGCFHGRPDRPAHEVHPSRRHLRFDAALSLRRCWPSAWRMSGRARTKTGFESDIYIKWRVEGTEGLAQGTIGWPDYPKGSPSTLRYCCRAT